jgi:hypothetical protein
MRDLLGYRDPDPDRDHDHDPDPDRDHDSDHDPDPDPDHDPDPDPDHDHDRDPDRDHDHDHDRYLFLIDRFISAPQNFQYMTFAHTILAVAFEHLSIPSMNMTPFHRRRLPRAVAHRLYSLLLVSLYRYNSSNTGSRARP